MNQTYKNYPIYKHTREKEERVTEGIIVEQPVSLSVNGKVWLTFMCSPIHLEALAAGFLYNERIISSRQEIEDIRVCKQRDNIDVWLNFEVTEPTDWRRTSGCTGGYTATILEDILPIPNDNIRLSPSQIFKLIKSLFESQDIYRKSGGVHASALSSPDGIIFQSEDVGRHNTLDKIAGKIILEDLKVRDPIILSTGRISSEMLQKTARMQVPILISRTSPTTMSINLADELGITLIGYARYQQFNVYTHNYRIKPDDLVSDLAD